mmetsp:Transcript_36183/g.85848  ORF Transcript_36183/g.85848 Transcript_36183/m.85848 type:complete len:335 (-) Transcript_36183:210-1214(-)
MGTALAISRIIEPQRHRRHTWLLSLERRPCQLPPSCALSLVYLLRSSSSRFVAESADMLQPWSMLRSPASAVAFSSPSDIRKPAARRPCSLSSAPSRWQPSSVTSDSATNGVWSCESWGTWSLAAMLASLAGQPPVAPGGASCVPRPIPRSSWLPDGASGLRQPVFHVGLSCASGLPADSLALVLAYSQRLSEASLRSRLLCSYSCSRSLSQVPSIIFACLCDFDFSCSMALRVSFISSILAWAELSCCWSSSARFSISWARDSLLYAALERRAHSPLRKELASSASLDALRTSPISETCFRSPTTVSASSCFPSKESSRDFTFLCRLLIVAAA